MFKNLFYSIVGLSITFGLLSCESKPKSDRTDTYSSGFITFAADESFSPIIQEQMDVFHADYPDAHVTPIYTNELDAINFVLSDSLYLAITSRRFTSEEFDNLKARGFQPRVIPIAYDGLALICNNQNTDSCISVNDVRRVLSGEAKQWSDIVSGSKRGEIWVCFDNKQSSTVHYCVDSILGGKPINSDNIFAAKTSQEVIDYVEKTPNAIGIIGSNWLNDRRDSTNTTWKKNITVMSVSKADSANPKNSWKPYQAWLLDGRYPFVRTLYALLNDPRNGLPWGFAHFLEMPKGQLIFFKSGLLPVKGEISIRDVKVKDE